MGHLNCADVSVKFFISLSLFICECSTLQCYNNEKWLGQLFSHASNSSQTYRRLENGCYML